MSEKIKLPLFLISLFIITFLFKLGFISKGPYHSDTLGLAIAAEKMWETKSLIYLQGSGLPLTGILAAIFVGIGKFFGNTDIIFSVNLMSITFSSLSVVALYILMRNWFNDYAAFFAGGFLACNSLFMALSGFGNSHMPSVFFFLTSLILLHQFLKDSNFLFLVSGSIALGLMGATRLQDMGIAFLPILIYLFISDKKSSRWLSTIIFACTTTIITFLFYLPKVLTHSAIATNKLNSTLSNEIFNILIPFDSFYYTNSWEYFQISFSSLGICVGLLGLILLYKDDKKKFILISFCFTFFTFFYNHMATSVPRFYAVGYIALIISQGFTIAKFYSYSKTIKVFSVSIFISILCINFINIYPVIATRHNNALLPDYYQWVKSQTEENAVIIERDQHIFVKHYSSRDTFSLTKDLIVESGRMPSNYVAKINSYLNQNIPVYATESGIRGYNPKFQIVETITSNFELEYVGEHLIEDWHRGSLFQAIGPIRLFRIQKK